MPSQNVLDDMLLSNWVAAGIRDPRSGYEAIARQQRISPNQARKRVHQALERRGINPHHGPTLVSAWVKLSRHLLRGTDIV